ncbi:MAG: methyltransferase domain-containing protein [candidate division Zixibacteria bacterium]|nr:methyltransferase domain-containing protein [candidate division Zixibacteria bacterium]
MPSNDTEKVRGYFERASDLFNSIYTGEKSAFGRWLDKVLRPDLKERFLLTLHEVQKERPQSLIDIGVGPGQYLKAYAELGVPQITGLDFSEPMLDLARKLVGKPPDGVEIIYTVADFTEAEFKQKFDISVAMGVYDYVANPEAFLRKMKDISNTCMLASFPSISVWRTPIRKVRYAWKRCPVYFYNRGRIEILAEKVGFKNIEITKIRGSGMDYFVRFDC